MKTAIENSQRFHKGESNYEFDALYLRLKNGLMRVISKKSPTNKPVYHKYMYPPLYNYGKKTLKVLHVGFFVHEIISMVVFHLEKNLHSENYKSNTEIHPLLKEMYKYKRDIDKSYTHLINLKRALDIKTDEHIKKGESIDHIVNKSLQEDFEASMHHDGSFRMGQPYE
jgi:hypothetical protein